MKCPAFLRLVALLSAVSVCLAVSASPAQEVRELRRGRVTNFDADLIPFAAAQLDDHSLVFEPIGDAPQQTLSLDEVLRVEVEHGNQGGTYALAGGVSGFIGGLVGANSPSSGVEVSSSTKATIVAITTGLCAMAGYFVGAGQKTYEKVYENPILDEMPGSEYSSPALPSGGTVCRVCLHF